jgi:hypothetical protein
LANCFLRGSATHPEKPSLPHTHIIIKDSRKGRLLSPFVAFHGRMRGEKTKQQQYTMRYTGSNLLCITVYYQFSDHANGISSVGFDYAKNIFRKISSEKRGFAHSFVAKSPPTLRLNFMRHRVPIFSIFSGPEENLKF